MAGRSCSQAASLSQSHRQHGQPDGHRLADRAGGRSGGRATNQFLFTTEPPDTDTANHGTIGSVVVTNGGAGYTSPPRVPLTGGGGTRNASASATINSIRRGHRGERSTAEQVPASVPTVTINPPAQTATATATVSTGPGVINGRSPIGKGDGTGFTSVPAVWRSPAAARGQGTRMATAVLVRYEEAGQIKLDHHQQPPTPATTSAPTISIAPAHGRRPAASATIGANGKTTWARS